MKRSTAIIVLAAAFTLGSLSSCPPTGSLPPDQQPFDLAAIFFTTDDENENAQLMQVDANGANPVVLSSYGFSSVYVSEMKLDADTAQLYLTSRAEGVFRTDLRTGISQKLIPNTGPDLLARTTGLALDNVRRQMYWCDFYEYEVRHSTMEGTTVESIKTQMAVTAVAVDSGAGEIYYASRHQPFEFGFDERAMLIRADLDGADARLLTENFGYPGSIALDLHRGYVYLVDVGFTNPFGGASFLPNIYRMKLDGTRRTTVSDFDTDLYGEGPRPYDIAIDFKAQKLYWTRNSLNPLEGRIQRANLDGSNVEDVVILPRHIHGLALSPSIFSIATQ